MNLNRQVRDRDTLLKMVNIFRHDGKILMKYRSSQVAKQYENEQFSRAGFIYTYLTFEVVDYTSNIKKEHFNILKSQI